VELLVDYLVLVLLSDHDYFLQYHHTLAAREHLLLHMYHYVHHLAHLLHHHFQLVVGLNLKVLG
jgi:hypothetical protein